MPTTTGQVLTWNSTLVAPLQFEWVTPAAQTYAPAVFYPVGQEAVDSAMATLLGTSFQTAEVSNDSRGYLLGRIGKPYTQANIVYEVIVAANNPTWAELAICKATPVPGAGTNLTTLGYADISATIQSTGVKNTAITITGLAAGEFVWVVWGCKDTVTMPEYYANSPDRMQSGCFLGATARPSTMAAATAFGLLNSTVLGMSCFAFFSSGGGVGG